MRVKHFLIFYFLGNDSIILMAVNGPEYEFIFADVGMNGRMSDGRNWARNEFRAALADVDNPLSIPNPKPLPGRAKPVPYVCVGDDAFGLTSYMMKPYPNTGLTEQKSVQLSSIQMSENIKKCIWHFGKLMACFQKLYTVTT